MKRLIVGCAIVALLSACAQRPASISPAPMPGGMYSETSCTAARAEYQQVSANLKALEKKQNSAATGDAIGVFLVLLPLGSVFGEDVSGEIATTKGQKIALESRLRGCTA